MINILTYNTFLRPPPVKNNENDYKNERCDLIIQQLNSFDIVCLQEAFGFLNLRKLKIIDRAMKKGFVFAESPSPSFFSGSLIDGGLLTLSKFPIEYSEFRAFPYGILSDNLSMKGILYTKISIKDQILHLFNAHLQASYIGNEENVIATVKTRIDQLKCYRAFISKFSYSPKDLILLAGDFNVDARQKDIIKYLGLTEYESMIRILGYQENITNCLPEFPITYADPETNELCLTAKEDQGTAQCLDYFFTINSQESTLKFKSARVEPFRIEGFTLLKNELCGQAQYVELMQLHNQIDQMNETNFELTIAGMKMEFDWDQHITHIKIRLDRFVSGLIESDAILSGHRLISNGLTQIKKSLIKAEPVVPLLKEELKKVIPITKRVDTEQLNQELENEIFNITQQMRSIAENINQKIHSDNKLINSIDSKQNRNLKSLDMQKGQFNQFANSKSLSCSALMQMVIIAFVLFIFTFFFISFDRRISIFKN